MLDRTTPKAEIVSSPTELVEARKDFLKGYPWDSNDENSFIVHSWNAHARFQFRVKRASLIKINQISDILVHVNFYFWGDVDDGWGQKGVQNEELPDFMVFLQSLSGWSKFLVGTIGFHVWTMSLFSTDEAWPHPDYDLKNLTREVIETNADEFTYVIVRKDFLNLQDDVPGEDNYFTVKIDDVLKQNQI